MAAEIEKKDMPLSEPATVVANGIMQEGKIEEAEDNDLLAQMGYKQELRRHYSTMEVFAIAFSIMALLPSIASTLAFSMPAGPVGMVWVSWISASCFILLVGLAMADLASAMPTAGGLYFWTHYFSNETWRNPLSFVVGYSNTLGLIGGLCSIDYGFALMLLSLVSISRDGEWSASRGVIYATYLATVTVHGLMATFLGRVMNRLQTICVVLNIVIIIATVIALPVGNKNSGVAIQSGDYVFGKLENLTTWPAGWTFMLSWLSPIWTIGAFDSCVHMSEEATHASKAVPLGIILSIGLCGILGFFVMSVIVACMDTNISNLMNTSFGQPMAQIYYDSLGKSGALGFMAVIAIVQFLMGLSILVAASRQTWAFSRDGALPFSNFFRHVSKKIQYQPVRTVWGVAGLAIIIGLLTLIDSAAANALFSLAVAANDFAWGTPILCRLIWGDKTGKFKPGVFYTGVFSKPIAITAVLYLIFAIFLCMFPTEGPNTSASSMNYTVVINGAVWIGSALYYFLFARKWYKGPKSTVA